MLRKSLSTKSLILSQNLKKKDVKLAQSACNLVNNRKNPLPVILCKSAIKRIFGVCNENENTYPCSRAKLLMVDMATTAVLVPLCTSKNRASVTL